MSGIMDKIFGRKLTAEELTKKWRSSSRAQQRELDRSIRAIENEEIKTKNLVKQAAKRNDIASCKLLAREIVRARKAKDRMHTSKAHLNSIIMQLEQQAAQMKVAGNLGKSKDIMKLVNQLVKVGPLQESMREMQSEMIKAGIIEEMMSDTLALPDEDDVETEADEEVDKVFLEITQGILGKAGSVGDKLPAKEVDVETEEEANRILQEMEKQLGPIANN